MDKLRAHRKKYDPFWDIDPIELRCGLTESIDLIERISRYLKDESSSQPFTPFFLLTEQRPTLARFDIFDRGGDNPDRHLPNLGQIEIIMTGNGSRLALYPNFRNAKGENARRVAVVHGIYRVMLNVFSIHDVLHDPDLPDRFAHGFADVTQLAKASADNNVSGGITFNGGQIEIGGDAVGRDKNIYYIAPNSTVNIVSGIPPNTPPSVPDGQEQESEGKEKRA